MRGFKNLNATNKPYKHATETPFKARSNKGVGLSKHHRSEDWTVEEVREATQNHVVFTWGATGPGQSISNEIKSSEGVYLIDFDGNKYFDLSSQAVNNNLGYTIPPQILNAITKQLQTLHMTYGGTSITEPKAKLAQLLNDITPENITGFMFPCTGSEANEAAIRIARRYTGKQKILSRYRSYHGGTTGPLSSTGDFRRQFGEPGVSGYSKFFDYQPMHFQWGKTEEESIKNYLAYVEEFIISEYPQNTAAMIIETIVGANGVLISPPEIVKGLRALCDKYGILLILDEVMAGFGRTGEMFSFQHYEGVVPDIFTSAKGLSGSFIPLSMVGISKPIQDHFKTNPLGWGTTFQAHQVACMCAYENLRYMLEKDIVGNVQKVQPLFY